jgi:aminoglycoside phosphotransferase (APT) family kinase protein
VPVGSVDDRGALTGADLERALLAVLERAAGRAGLRYARRPTPLSGGWWAALYGFCIENAPRGFEGELVLRLMPDDARARREVVIQHAVAATGFPAPKVRLAGDRAAGLGASFSIMDRAPGGSLASGLAGGERLRAFRRAPVLLGETMAALHRLDPTPVLEALARAGLPRIAQGVAGLLEEIGERVAQLRLRGFDSAVAWLHARRVEPEWLVVCHGDLHPLNLVISEGRVSALVDWTNARIAEPAFDVAYTAQLLEAMPVAAPRAARPLLRLLGRRAAHRFVESYQGRSAFDAARLRWYEALHALHLLARVAEARSGPAQLLPTHPWEIAAPAAAATLEERTGLALSLPARPS